MYSFLVVLSIQNRNMRSEIQVQYKCFQSSHVPKNESFRRASSNQNLYEKRPMALRWFAVVSMFLIDSLDNRNLNVPTTYVETLLIVSSEYFMRFPRSSQLSHKKRLPTYDNLFYSVIFLFSRHLHHYNLQLH